VGLEERTQNPAWSPRRCKAAPTAGRLEIEAYDAAGRLVGRLATNVKPGPGAVNWKPMEMGADLYFLKVKMPGRESVIKALLTE